MGGTFTGGGPSRSDCTMTHACGEMKELLRLGVLAFVWQLENTSAVEEGV